MPSMVFHALDLVACQFCQQHQNSLPPCDILSWCQLRASKPQLPSWLIILDVCFQCPSHTWYHSMCLMLALSFQAALPIRCALTLWCCCFLMSVFSVQATIDITVCVCVCLFLMSVVLLEGGFGVGMHKCLYVVCCG